MSPFVIFSLLALCVPVVLILWILKDILDEPSTFKITKEIDTLGGIIVVGILPMLLLTYYIVKAFRLMNSNDIKLKISGIVIFRDISISILILISIGLVGGFLIELIKRKLEDYGLRLVDLAWKIGTIAGLIWGLKAFFTRNVKSK